MNLPWEIALLESVDGKVTRHKSFYVYWGSDFKVGKAAARITGYDSFKVKNQGIPPEEAYGIISDYFNNAEYLAGHNILGFDIYIMNSFFKKLGKPELDLGKYKGCVDTLALAKGLAMNIPYKTGEDLFLYQLKMLNIRLKGSKLKLSDLAKSYGVDLDESNLHQAGYDLDINARVWNKLKYQLSV